ncbi:MAG: purine-nucleoside phosphorylase [Acidobacteria bacterium]|nr:purine-nucleoside phosphorylase [Acidobacteriota bacterium]
MTTRLTPDGLRRIADEFSRSHSPGRVRGLLIAGSGLTLEVPGWEVGEVVAMGDLLPFPIRSLAGHDHTLTVWRRGVDSLLVMNGRFHLYQGYAQEEVVAPVRLAALLGAEVLIATNATGSLDPEVEAGSLVVVSDHLNLQGSNPLAGVWGPELGPQFPDMTEAYDPELRELAHRAAAAAGFTVHEGVYAAVLGPSFETPAEVRMLRQLGGAVVGMSTVPEVIAARHMGMRVLVLSLASNPAAGINQYPLSHEEVLAAGHEAADRLRDLVRRLVAVIFPES